MQSQLGCFSEALRVSEEVQLVGIFCKVVVHARISCLGTTQWALLLTPRAHKRYIVQLRAVFEVGRQLWSYNNKPRSFTAILQ